MWAWLQLLKALVTLTAALAGFLSQRRLIAAGEAQAIASALRDADEAIDKARAARDRVRLDLESDPGRLREPDEFKRD
jgi:hypothetical protein